jgi:hypothetical protein
LSMAQGFEGSRSNQRGQLVSCRSHNEDERDLANCRPRRTVLGTDLEG